MQLEGEYYCTVDHEICVDNVSSLMTPTLYIFLMLTPSLYLSQNSPSELEKLPYLLTANIIIPYIYLFMTTPNPSNLNMYITAPPYYFLQQNPYKHSLLCLFSEQHNSPWIKQNHIKCNHIHMCPIQSFCVTIQSMSP